jgi:type IV pilus assembly protein PilY1
MAARLAAACCLFTLSLPAVGQVTVTLADQPPFSNADVPGNLALTLSVEYPTAISVANLNDYSDSSTYFGYFDPNKCYTYTYDSTTANDLSTNPQANSYFQPAAMATGTNSHSCSGMWSGNFMNWATMQTIDPFRWALTGGYRVVDTTSMTVIEKAWGAAQGSLTNFPYRGTGQSTGQKLNTATVSISSVTPFSKWTAFNTAIWSNGNMMVFSNDASAYKTLASNSAVKDLSNLSSANKSTNTSAYRVLVRVRVCDKTTSLGINGLESNCVGYGTASVSNGVTTYSIYKPEGLMQQYSNKIRFAALSYLNGSGSTRQGGVLREPMGFIGPTYPQPFSTTTVNNSRAEWSAATGIMNTNPDTTMATASGVSQSGVMNFLNKFGEYGHTYMMYDNVSELYYAAVRYYENLGNVPEWTNNATSTELDGFPAATTWVDPISYWCQKNFVLGIGDDHTWYDYNVGGGTVTGSRTKPASVASDAFNKAHTWTANLQTLEGINPTTDVWPFDSGATYYIAGLAYGTHVLDIRSDLINTQTISTYWMDVAEYQRLENRNPYYLAAKYGGFTVPANYDITQTSTPLDPSLWNTNGTSIAMTNPTGTYPLPDNYFPAGSAGAMVSSLRQAFTNIAHAITPFGTSFSPPSPTVSAGSEFFLSQYDSHNWTSTVTGAKIQFDPNGNPSSVTVWQSSSTLENQLAGTGWQNNRRVATWSGSAGVPFEYNNLTSAQQSALLPTSYSSTTSVVQYLDYLRGDRTNEVGSTVAGSTKSLRSRTLLLGDIIDASLATIAGPIMPFSDTSNPGYADFKSKKASRPTMVYAAANDGMLHAFVGDTGLEQFAYVPSALFQGPSGTPLVDGLAALGNPNFSHHYYVDATPVIADLDLDNTGGNPGNTPAWRTYLIGGLGKGGRSFYAIDITDPAGMNTETAVAGAVKWEFTDSTMGFSYGTPRVFKTKKYGWVVALTSGYDNSDGYGYLYLVNPSNGTLLEKIKTPTPSSGLTQAMGFAPDQTDYTADSVYAGDLNGQVWRFDLTGTSGYYNPPTQIALLTDPTGNPQPITVPPLIDVHPTNRERYVMIATGKLLANQDIGSTQIQTFYAIIDGTNAAFKSFATPVGRANLAQVTSLLTPPSGLPMTTSGWYYDLHVGRVITPLKSYYGYAGFVTLDPSLDACSPTGTGDVYAFNYATGSSALYPTINNATIQAEYVSYGNPITEFGFFLTPNGVEAIVGTNGQQSKVPTKLTPTASTRILNWSELPAAD